MQRLSVNINEESAEILRLVTANRDWTTTEAIRIAIGLLGFHEGVLHFQNQPARVEGKAVHHINGNPYDNRPENLEIVEVTENG